MCGSNFNETDVIFGCVCIFGILWSFCLIFRVFSAISNFGRFLPFRLIFGTFGYFFSTFLQDRTQDLFMRMMSHPIAEEHLPSALMTFYTGKIFWHFFDDLGNLGKGQQIFFHIYDIIVIIDPIFKIFWKLVHTYNIKPEFIIFRHQAR